MKKMIAVLMVAVTLTFCFGGALVVVNNAIEVTKEWDEIWTDDSPAPQQLPPLPSRDKNYTKC
ncbi:MAG: hypothetical protein IKX99_03980 [Lachnospiraceae bacterium]|nr:hypothetical protein [Lachnospiraceae bacterium]